MPNNNHIKYVDAVAAEVGTPPTGRPYVLVTIVSSTGPTNFHKLTPDRARDLIRQLNDSLKLIGDK